MTGAAGVPHSTTRSGEVMDRKWWTLIAVCFGTFMLLLDITVVNVALPDIQRSLHSSFSDLQWVVDAYSLTLAAFLLTAGVLGDIYGRREVFAIGLAIFSLASLVCGLSTTPLMLNLARAVQGVGGAVMFATSLALIANAFVGKDRGTAFGLYGAVIGGAVAVGPLIGGAITSGIGWRWIFFVNVPIGVVAVAITLTKIAESKDQRVRRIDWIGFITFSASLFTLVFALVRGNDLGWGSASIIGLLVASAVLMVAFFLNESRTSDPMLDLGLFKIPAFVGISIVAFTLAASIFAMFLYLTLYIQDDLGYGPLAAGIRFLPITLVSFFVAFFAGRLTVLIQSRLLLGVGMTLVTGGLLFMAFTHPDSGWTVLLPGFVLCGLGIGTVNPVLASGAVSVVQPQRSGMASGANNTFRQVGIATGIAVLGAVFQSQIVQHTTAALSTSAAGRAVLHRGGAQLNAALPAGEVRQVASSISVPSARQALLDAYRIGFSSTLNHLMIIGAIVAFVGVVSAITLVRQRDFVVPGAGGPPGGGGAAGGGAAPGAGDSAGGRADGSRPAAERPADATVPAAHA
jgi:EmrB/QacA subfamily drug resistance transporter